MRELLRGPVRPDLLPLSTGNDRAVHAWHAASGGISRLFSSPRRVDVTEYRCPCGREGTHTHGQRFAPPITGRLTTASGEHQAAQGGPEAAHAMIVIMSLWRNDADRRLEDRVEHLLSKCSRQHQLQWLWITGDNSDETTQRLGNAVISVKNLLRSGKPCPLTIIDADTGIVGEDVETRRRRGSATATEMFSHIPAAADYVLLHESDLQSEVDIVDQLFDAGGGAPIAGWPTININAAAQFYDMWAYRDLHGRQFMPREPFSEQYRPDRPFPVGSFGSVWLAPADLVRDRVITDRAILELCEQWRSEGVELLCDPRIPIIQPVNLWSPSL